MSDVDVEWFFRNLIKETQWANADEVQPPFDCGERIEFLHSLKPRTRLFFGAKTLPTEERGPMGECFANALRFASLYGEGYAEGVAEIKDVQLHHAWFSGPCGEATECTWFIPSQLYTGVVFTPEEVNYWQGRGPSRSILWSSEAQYLAAFFQGTNLLEQAILVN